MEKENRLVIIVIICSLLSFAFYSWYIDSWKEMSGYNRAKIQEMRDNGFDVDSIERKAEQEELERQYRKYSR